MFEDSDDGFWNQPPKPITLGEQVVHIWRARLDLNDGDLETYWNFLNSEERWRAERYKFLRDRRRYIARRGILRFLLSEYLGRGAADLKFALGLYGKPFVGEAFAGNRFSFNLSHSAGTAVFAFIWSADIGVDIERWRTDFDVLKLAERYFSEAEREALLALREDERISAFYAGWTRKEAFIKAHGEGLSLALDLFDVSLEPGEGAKLLATRGNL